ncbi:ATPase domain-containing protein [Terriglobus sp. TAA 43]|uniref:ATPase domain-containing protein n=1 Tax=Terriglobus sp. TAA 43 TaxID=278961 RepID=UPI000645FEAE|nr:ATPase domain-containing protein [Terriglobus sp. TAA 43]
MHYSGALPTDFNLTRLTTGVAGLDDILAGGLPTGQMYLLEGDPGTGKTTLAMQFILEGFRHGQKGLYVTLSEPRAELELTMRSHSWKPAELPVVEFLPDEASLSAEQQYRRLHMQGCSSTQLKIGNHFRIHFHRNDVPTLSCRDV